jgi:hypothetical protein
MATNGKTVVEHSPHHLKIEVLSPAAETDMGREKMAKHIFQVVDQTRRKP